MKRMVWTVLTVAGALSACRRQEAVAEAPANNAVTQYVDERVQAAPRAQISADKANAKINEDQRQLQDTTNP